MPTAYKGKIRITCGKEACPNDPARADVGSDCFICSDSQSEILDLEDRTIIGRRPDPGPEILPEIDQAAEPEQITSGTPARSGGTTGISAAKRLKLVKKED